MYTHSAEHHTETIICRASKVLAGIIPNNYPPTPLKCFPHCLKAGAEISRRVQMDGGNKHEIKQRCFEPTIFI